MTVEEKTMLSKTADAVTDSPITIEVDILNPTRLQRLRKETKKTFKLTPATLGTLVKISKELLSIDVAEADKSNWIVLCQKLMLEHGNRLARIVAIAIVNRKEDPPNSLIEFIEYNMTAKELNTIAAHVLDKMDMRNFITSIISIKAFQFGLKRAKIVQRLLLTFQCAIVPITTRF
jgi:hypothetical protein